MRQSQLRSPELQLAQADPVELLTPAASPTSPFESPKIAPSRLRIQRYTFVAHDMLNFTDFFPRSSPSHGGHALVDTGALCSAIDDEIAAELKIPVIDKGKMISASHDSHPCNFYPIQISIGPLTFKCRVPQAQS